MENLLPEGDFRAEVRLSGGTGRTAVLSPADVHIKDGVITAEIVWSSSNYDYMEIGGVGYSPISYEGGSAFLVEIPAFNTEIPIQAETVAMSAPHMIEYTLWVSGEGILSETDSDTENSESSAVSESTSIVSEVTVSEPSGTFSIPVAAGAFGGALAAAIIAAIFVQLVKRKKK